jgi:hypothetical protein
VTIVYNILYTNYTRKARSLATMNPQSPLLSCECEALFSSKIFCKIDTVAFSFVFDKYCPMD